MRSLSFPSPPIQSINEYNIFLAVDVVEVVETVEKSALSVSVRQMRQFLFCKTVLKTENANVEFFSTKFSTPLFCLTLWKTAGIL